MQVATSLGKIESEVQTALQKLSVQSVNTQHEVHSPRRSFISVRATSAKQQKCVESAPETQESVPRFHPPTTSTQKEEKTKKHKNGKFEVPSADFISSLRSKETVADRKSKETIELYATKQIMRTETETESDSESEAVNVVQTKPSTTSTLGQYSSSR